MDGDKSEHLLEAIPVMASYCDIIGVRSFAGLTDREYDYAETVLNQFIRYSGKPVSVENPPRQQILHPSFHILHLKNVPRWY